MTERMVDSGTSGERSGNDSRPERRRAAGDDTRPGAEARAAARRGAGHSASPGGAAGHGCPVRGVGLAVHRRTARRTAARAVHRLGGARDPGGGPRRPHRVDPDLAEGVVPPGRLRLAGAARGEDLDAADRLVLLPDPRPVPQRPDHVRARRGGLRDAAGQPRRRDRGRRRRDRRDPAGVVAGLGPLGDLVAVGGGPHAGARCRLHHRRAHRPRRDDRGVALALASAGAGGAVVLRHRRVPVRGHVRPTSPTRSRSASGSSSGSGCSAWNRDSGRARAARPACSPSAACSRSA